MSESRIQCWRPNPSAEIRLFCFPYAGAGAAVYRAWPRELPDTVELWAVQPPGRGSRLRETPHTRLVDVAAEAAAAILPRTDRPFALFGHSLGALVSFEAARALRRQGREPIQLFVSGRRAPQLADDEPPLHALPDADLVEEIRRRYDAIPEAVYREPELLRVFLPAMRADFQALETYTYAQGAPLDCVVSAFAGEQDPRARTEHLEGWREQTRGRFSREMLPGGHFYFNQGSQSCLLAALARELAPAAIASGADA